MLLSTASSSGPEFSRALNPKKRAVFPCGCVAAFSFRPDVSLGKKGMKHKKGTGSQAVRFSNGVFVEFMTPKGKVFSGRATAVRFSPANTVVQLEPGAVSYFGLINSGELVLRIGSKFHCFALFRGSASIREHRLTVLAETITPMTAPFENCGNPTCDWGHMILDRPNAISRLSVSSIFCPRRGRQRRSAAAPSVRATRQKKKRKQ